jgi:hypothetical protein
MICVLDGGSESDIHELTSIAVFIPGIHLAGGMFS